MKISKSKIKQIVKEELESVLNEANEEKYRLIIPKVICLMGQCQQPGMRVVELEPGTIVAAAKGRAKTAEEANKIAHAALAKKLAAKGLNIKKIKVLPAKK